MRKLVNIALIIVAFVAAIGCEHHDLYHAQYDYAHVRIDLDWSEAGLDATPNGVTAIAYEHETGDMYSYYSPFTTIDYVDVGLPVGTYDVVLFNNSESEFQYIDFLNTTQLSTLIANGVETEPVRALSKSDEDKDVISHPDVIASSKVENIIITSDMVNYTLDMPDIYETVIAAEYETKPQRRVVNVTIYCRTIGVEFAAGAPRTFFKHFSGGYLLGLEEADERQVIQEVVLSTILYDDETQSDATIWQEFTSFGEVTEQGATYVVDAEFTLVDGETYGAVFDVTDQIEVYMDGYIPRIDIYVEVELPVAIATTDSNSSFETEVEAWDNIVVTLPM